MTTSILVTDYGRSYGRSQAFPSSLTADFLTLDRRSVGTTTAKLVGGPNLTYRVFVPDGAAAIEFASIELKDGASNVLFVWTSTELIHIAERQSLTVDIVVPAYSVVSDTSQEAAQLRTTRNVYTSVDALPSVSEDPDPSPMTAVVIMSDTSATLALRANGLWSLPTHAMATSARLVFGGEAQSCRLDFDAKDIGLPEAITITLLQFLDDARGTVRVVRVLGSVSPTSYDVEFDHQVPSAVSSGTRVLVYTSGNAVNRSRVEDTQLKAALARLDNFVNAAASRDTVDTLRKEFEAFKTSATSTQDSMKTQIATLKTTLEAFTSSVSVAPRSNKSGRY